LSTIVLYRISRQKINSKIKYFSNASKDVVASVVQGERKAELVRALLSRSPHSRLHLKCKRKITKNPLIPQKMSGEKFEFHTF
jgi:hypothetical protein